MSTPVTAQTARLPILDAVVTRLRTLEGLTVYRGEVRNPDGTTLPPVLMVDGEPDPSGRVAPYAVVYGGVGRLDPNPSLEPAPADHLWSGQVTFTAGFEDDLLAVLDDALPLLNLWSPDIDGLDCGHLRPPPGFDPGTARRDTNARPHRYFTPTLWQLHVTTA